MTVLFIDVSNLAWRAYYTTGELKYKNKHTGVMFGVLRDIKSLRERFGTDDMAFFFDHPHYFRKDDFPYYKARAYDALRAKAEREVHKQTDLLRREHLPKLGFENLYYEDGFEADDLIARCTVANDDVIIVSSDEDLYQLLDRGHDIRLYKPIKGISYHSLEFRTEFWGLSPKRWNEVKAIAGCKSDNITGCWNVGEYAASKYLSGQLGDGMRKTAIEEFIKTDRYRDNLCLTTIPYRDVPKLECHPVKPFNRKHWNDVMESLGMTTLMEVRKGLKAK